MASQITSNSTVCSGIHQRKYWSSTLPFVRGIHRWPMDSPHKGPVIYKMFPCYNAIMFQFNMFALAAFIVQQNLEIRDLAPNHHWKHKIRFTALNVSHDILKWKAWWSKHCPAIKQTCSREVSGWSCGLWQMWRKYQNSNVQVHIKGRYLEHLLWNCLQLNATRPHWWLVNTGSGDGLVPSGNKPLPETMLTQIYVTIWHH